MTDREKVVKGLECCVAIPDGAPCPNDCPYAIDYDCDGYAGTLFRDALALLKEQEPDLPGTWLLDRPNHYKCSVCGAQWGQAARMMRHCPDCGRRMEI